jgi:hypothetical protein
MICCASQTIPTQNIVAAAVMTMAHTKGLRVNACLAGRNWPPSIADICVSSAVLTTI